MNFAILAVYYTINMCAKIFHSRKTLIPGSSYTEVVARARKEFNTIRRITKRQPYVRSKYFRGDKIFHDGIRKKAKIKSPPPVWLKNHSPETLATELMLCLVSF